MQSARMTSIAVLTGMCLVSGAYGGMRLTGPVIVDTVNNYAAGHLGTAYDSSESLSEYIGCVVVYGPGLSYATCSAANSAGVSRACTTTSPSMIAVVRSLDSSAAISFSWDANSTCTMLTSQQFSFQEPKVWGGRPY